MNKISIIIDSVLGVAVIALFVLFFTVKPNGKPAQVEVNGQEVQAADAELPIAFLNLDSLLVNYQFAIDANDRLMSKQEDARLKLNTRARNFQSKYEEFQRKLNNNAFLSRDRAEQEANKLQKEQEDIQALEAKLTNDIMIENQNLNMQMADTLTSFLKEYNADGRFKMILSNTAKDNVLMADDALDITADVIEKLNARYSSK